MTDFRPFLLMVEALCKDKKLIAQNKHNVEQQGTSNGNDSQTQARVKIESDTTFNSNVASADVLNFEQQLAGHGVYFDHTFAKRAEDDKQLNHDFIVHCVPPFDVHNFTQDKLHRLIMQCSNNCNNVLTSLSLHPSTTQR